MARLSGEWSSPVWLMAWPATVCSTRRSMDLPCRDLRISDRRARQRPPPSGALAADESDRQSGEMRAGGGAQPVLRIREHC